MEEELNGKFHYVRVDLRSEEDILEAFKWIRSTLKSIDVLINNAGVLKPSDVLGSTDDWKQMFDINVLGLNICSREAVKIMKETNIEDGHIININSIAGQQLISYVKYMAVYSSTKFCVTTLTEYLRQYMSLENLPIRVTSISPGIVDTEMIEQFKFTEMAECEVLKPIDIVIAILYALGAPKRVNVSEITLVPSAENNVRARINAGQQQ